MQQRAQALPRQPTSRRSARQQTPLAQAPAVAVALPSLLLLRWTVQLPERRRLSAVAAPSRGSSACKRPWPLLTCVRASTVPRAMLPQQHTHQGSPVCSRGGTQAPRRAAAVLLPAPACAGTRNGMSLLHAAGAARAACPPLPPRPPTMQACRCSAWRLRAGLHTARRPPPAAPLQQRHTTASTAQRAPARRPCAALHAL